MPRMMKPFDESLPQESDLPANIDDEFLRQELRRRLKEKYRAQQPVIDEFVPGEETGRRARNYAFSDALMSNAAQIGTMHGKQADTDSNYKLSKSLTDSEEMIGDSYLQNQDKIDEKKSSYLKSLDALSDSDPNSAPSALYREVIQRMYPGIAEKLGPKFGQMSKADFEKALPLVAKMVARTTGKDSGSKLTDYTQDGVPMVFDPETGELRPARISDGQGNIVNSKEKIQNQKLARQSEKDRLDAEYKRASMSRMAKQDEKATESERTAAMFYNTAENALKKMQEIEDSGYKPGAKVGITRSLVPEGLQPYALSDIDQQYQQAAEDFYAAKLRLESGANIPPSELSQQARIYIRKPGESDALLEQKRQSRSKALEGLKIKAGRAAQLTSAGQSNKYPRTKDKQGVMREKREDGKWYPVEGQ